MRSLFVRYQIVTPLFMAGANVTKAEMRLPSIKGALRYWMRAIHPGIRREMERSSGKRSPVFEEWMLGSSISTAGQSKFFFHWEEVPPNKQRQQYRQNHTDFQEITHLTSPFSQVRSGKTINRSFFNAGASFSFRIYIHPEHEENQEMWQTLLASLWLLGHVGGLGTNSRHGFGTVQLKDWNFDSDNKEWLQQGQTWLDQLPIAHGAEKMDTWVERFLQGMRTIQNWVEHFLQQIDQPVVNWFHPGENVQDRPQYPRIDAKSVLAYPKKGESTWQKALYQGHQPIAHYRRLPTDLNVDDPKRMKRLALGLPAKMRVSKKEVTYKYNGNSGRFPSPVWVRVIQIQNQYYPLLFFISTPFPEQVESSIYKEKKRIPNVNKKDKDYHQKTDQFQLLLQNGIDEFQSQLRNHHFVERKVLT